MATLVIRLIVLARRARKDYGALICMGICTLLVVQTLENIGMCLAMLPVVGITLPFCSYGGSSMLAAYIYLGFVMSISAHNKKYYFWAKVTNLPRFFCVCRFFRLFSCKMPPVLSFGDKNSRFCKL